MVLCCPVCGLPLVRGDHALRCAAGHSFDVARQGYVNLLTVSQKHSKSPGDTREQVQARRAFLAGGYYRPIAETLCRLAAPLGPKTIVDAGCGEGYYLAALQEALPGADCLGLDISKEAVRCAAGAHKSIAWITATAAAIPLTGASCDLVLSLFALTAAGEFYRVLRPGGHFLQVLAGPDHLLGLKSVIYPELFHREKISHPELPGFSLVQTETLEFSFTLEGPAVQNLLYMTPHVYRIGKAGADRLRATETLTDTAHVIFNLYCKE